MNDDQLTTELHRRAQARPVPDLLPAVRAAIDTRPQPVITSRLAPLAGLVGIAAALVLLVIALPRLGLGPSASDSVTVPSPAPSAVADGATPIVAADAITCSGEGTEVSLPVVTFQDATGLVESCRHVEPSGAGADATGAPSVVNPDGDSTVLQIEWSGNIGCTSAASFDFTTATSGYTLEGTLHGFEVCRLRLVIHAIRVELGAEVPAEQVVAADLVRITEPNPTPRTEVGSAWWELAAHERPTAESTELDLMVFELACASGQSPEGRIVGPETFHSEGAVTITFSVTPLAGGADCQMAPGAPVTVQLSEPVGDRRLIDGSDGSPVTIERDADFLALSTNLVDEMAHERFEAMVGADLCTRTVVYDPYVPTHDQLKAAADALEGEEGFIEYGGYVTDDWLSAARAFRAIEAYVGRPKPWYIVIPGEPYPLLLPLDPFPLSGGRTVWFRGFYQGTIVDLECHPAPSEPPVVQSPIECPYPSDSGRPTEVSIVDHSGLVVGCEAFVEPSTPDEFVEVINTGSDRTSLEVRWEIGEVCTAMPVRLKLRGPLIYEFPTLGPSPPFALQIEHRSSGGMSQACRTAVGTQGVRLSLASPIPSKDVEAFRTLGLSGYSVARVGDHSLTVALWAGSLLYEGGEPIDLTARLLYSGPDGIARLDTHDPNPAFGFDQLDGQLRQVPLPDWLPAAVEIEIERDVPLVVPFEKQGFCTCEEADGPYSQDGYWADQRLRLPPGTYRIHVSVGGDLDGDHLAAGTSIIITVR